MFLKRSDFDDASDATGQEAPTRIASDRTTEGSICMQVRYGNGDAIPERISSRKRAQLAEALFVMNDELGLLLAGEGIQLRRAVVAFHLGFTGILEDVGRQNFLAEVTLVQ
jgi:hypothetical protein